MVLKTEPKTSGNSLPDSPSPSASTTADVPSWFGASWASTLPDHGFVGSYWTDQPRPVYYFPPAGTEGCGNCIGGAHLHEIALVKSPVAANSTASASEGADLGATFGDETTCCEDCSTNAGSCEPSPIDPPAPGSMGVTLRQEPVWLPWPPGPPVLNWRDMAPPLPALEVKDFLRIPIGTPAHPWQTWLDGKVADGGGIPWSPPPTYGGGGSVALQPDKGKTQTNCGNIYYLDANGGDDKYSAKENSASKPWKTLWRLHVFLDKELPAGDRAVHVGDEFVFAPGEYNNIVPPVLSGVFGEADLLKTNQFNGALVDVFVGGAWVKATAFVFQATVSKNNPCKTYESIIFRAAIDKDTLKPFDGDVIWRGIVPPTSATKTVNAWNHNPIASAHYHPFRFNSQLLANADPQIPLHIENIYFIGRGDGKTIDNNLRAPHFVKIDNIGKLTMTNCSVGASSDAPDVADTWWMEPIVGLMNPEAKAKIAAWTAKAEKTWGLYSTIEIPTTESDVVKDVKNWRRYGGVVSQGGWLNLEITAVQKAEFNNCKFEAISNAAALGGKNPLWRYPPRATLGEGVTMYSCNNVVFKEGCEFGGCGHFALQMKNCYNITVQDCTIHNPIHSGISTEGSTFDCIFERNTFITGGAWYDVTHLDLGYDTFSQDPAKPVIVDNVIDNNALNISSGGHIIAFNLFKADPDALHGGNVKGTAEYLAKGPAYVGDRAVFIAGVSPFSAKLPGPAGYVVRAITQAQFAQIEWDNGDTDGVRQSLPQKTADKSLGWFSNPSSTPTCADGQAPKAMAAAAAGLSWRFQCDQSIAAPGQRCADFSTPTWSPAAGPVAPVWLRPDYASGKLSVELPAGAIRQMPRIRYDKAHFGEAACSKIAIFNNTIVDIGKSAIAIESDSCDLVVRDILVFNNIVLGQRNDVSAEFLNWFEVDNKHADLPINPYPDPAASPPLKPTLHEPAVRALLDLNAAGIYDGSAGIRIFSNAIGRRSSDARKISAEDWLGQYDPKAVNPPANVRQLLTAMAENYFKTLSNLDDKLAQHLELPHWAKLSAGIWNQTAKQVQVNPKDPFSTDWAVHLPSPFSDLQASYRWASVADLNIVWSYDQALPGLEPIGWDNVGVRAVLPDFSGKYLNPTYELAIATDGTASLAIVPPSGAEPWLPSALPAPNLASEIGDSVPAKAWLNPFESGNKFQFVDDYLQGLLPNKGLPVSYGTASNPGAVLLNGLTFKGARKP